MVKTIKKSENEDEIKKKLAKLKAELKQQTKVGTKKPVKAKKETAQKAVKAKKEAAQKADKAKKETAEKAAKAKKEAAQKAAKAKKAQKAAKAKKAQKAAKAKKEAAEKAKKEDEEAKTPEEELEEQFSDEQIRNFQIEKMDMDRITNKVCEIVSAYEDKGMLQSDLWKKLKLSNRDGSRLALRLERRGLISREKILQKDRWTYKLIIEQTPISLESLQNSPCLTCPVEQKCDVSNVYPEPSPLNCQLIEDWIVAEFSKKRK